MFCEDIDMKFGRIREKDQKTSRAVAKFKEQITNFEFDVDDLKKGSAKSIQKFN